MNAVCAGCGDVLGAEVLWVVQGVEYCSLTCAKKHKTKSYEKLTGETDPERYKNWVGR